MRHDGPLSWRQEDGIVLKLTIDNNACTVVRQADDAKVELTLQ